MNQSQNPKGQNPLRLPFASFRLILRLEKTATAGPRSHDCRPLRTAPAPRPDLLPQTAPPRHCAAASSTRKTVNPAAPAHDKTSPRSGRSDPALQPNHATLPTLPLDAGSFHKSATTGCAAQDGLCYGTARHRVRARCLPLIRMKRSDTGSCPVRSKSVLRGPGSVTVERLRSEKVMFPIHAPKERCPLFAHVRISCDTGRAVRDVVLE